jgi:hypothetical protein
LATPLDTLKLAPAIVENADRVGVVGTEVVVTVPALSFSQFTFPA